MQRIHLWSLVLSLSPMVLGFCVVIAWLATQWPWSMDAGVVVIVLGIAVAVVVPALLVLAWRLDVRNGGMPGPRAARTLLILLALLTNLPAYGGALAVVMIRAARYTVLLHNAADTPWAGVVLEGGGVRVEVPTMAPGAALERRLWFTTDGALSLADASPARTMVEEYVTQGDGGAAEVVRERDGSVVVKRAR